ncbi:MAG TPA: hypothetical protein VMF90_18700 [Rhizobiaceae bacterium]|nr:hypothetical protein [Rhizobiaceae bacterium]
MKHWLNLPLTALALTLPLDLARADVPGAAKTALSAESVAARDAALTELEAARSSDPLAAYTAGSVHFFMALEKLGQGLQRHGFESPQSFMLPLMRLPIPPNPNPEPLTYEQFRTIISDFHTEMNEAAIRLAEVPKDADIGIEVDLTRLGIDLNRDGAIAPNESALAIMVELNPGLGSEPPPPGALTFRFDRADGYWLQGYANFLMAQADFWLAHDFKTAFDGSFQMLFPRASLPLQEALVPKGPTPGGMFASEWRFADFVSFIHLINWPVVEPEMRKEARTHLLEMIRLSRENWQAIRAETDNEREWLPGPHQKGVHVLTGIEVTDTEVQAWHDALKMAEDLLEGRRLLPHFRIGDQGINMKRFFEEPTTFDLMLSITGPAIVPYLEKGPMLTSDEWWALQSQFGGAGFMTFAIWFN